MTTDENSSSAAVEENHLLEFYGEECQPCKAMKPLMKQLEFEEGITVKMYEVWHNSENLALMKKYDQDRCGSVPFLYNTKTNQWLCGSQSYEKIKAWALGANKTSESNADKTETSVAKD